MASLTKKKIRAIVFYNFRRDLLRQQCYKEMVHELDKDAPSLRTVGRRYKQFERGDFNLEDHPRPGRPRDVTTPETVAAVEKLVRENRRMTYKQIEETLKISACTVDER